MNSGFDMFQNSGYKNVRNRKKTLILDIEDTGGDGSFLGSAGEFNIKLYEPLIIDKHSEVYLDNFVTFNSNISSNSDDMAFLLKINEFNMNSNVASSHGASASQAGGAHIFNSIVIPNDHSDPSDFGVAQPHKAKKFNYICDINPQTINSISGKITNLAGKSIFHGAFTGDTDTYALTGISQAKVVTFQATTALSEDDFDPSEDHSLVTFPLRRGDKISKITFGGNAIGDENGTPIGTILVDTTSVASTILFSLNQTLSEEIINSLQTVAGDITFSVRRVNEDGSPISPGDPDKIFVDTLITIPNNPLTLNPDIQIIHGSGRFISEFTIIARE